MSTPLPAAPRRAPLLALVVHATRQLAERLPRERRDASLFAHVAEAVLDGLDGGGGLPSLARLRRHAIERIGHGITAPDEALLAERFGVDLADLVERRVRALTPIAPTVSRPATGTRTRGSNVVHLPTGRIPRSRPEPVGQHRTPTLVPAAT